MTVEITTKWSDFPKISTSEQMTTYLKDRLRGHRRYYHYTSLYAINAILGTRRFRISQVERFNDTKDAEQFGKFKKNYFSMCFSTGTNENLALWYLYSGMHGKGGRIGFNYSGIKSFIDNATYTLYEYDYDKKQEVGIGIPLIKDKDFKITLQDILYWHKNEDSKYCDLKYNTMTSYNNFPILEFEKYKVNNMGFCKGLIWYYEKESRILIELLGKNTDHIQQNKNYVIYIEFDEKIEKNMDISFAPEIDTFDSVIQDYEHIHAFIYNSSHVKLSKYKGEIKMGLCNRCDVKDKFCKECKQKREN